jgi:hypothetical protein
MARASMERAPRPARRRPPRIRHGLSTASSCRPPMTYGFNSDDESSPDAGSFLCSQAGLLAASGVSYPPEHHTVTQFLYATCHPGASGAATGVVQVGGSCSRRKIRVKAGPSGSDTWRWRRTDKGAAARTRQARHRRSMARRRQDIY